MFLSGIFVAVLTGCSAAVPLYVSPSAYDFDANRALRDRIVASPHGYFRFINIPFSEEVCRRFADGIELIPHVNLHGDAHLEQYAVTDLGRGLSDFDDTSVGPAVIDLVRLGVSVELTLRARGWQDHSAELFDRFLEGYQDALEDPTIVAPIPEIALEAIRSFDDDRAHYFEWIGTLMKALAKPEADRLRAAMKPYADAMRLEQPALSERFFDVIDVGRLEMGIGSALDRKFLIRVRGWTDDPLDDLILEAKEVRDLRAISCIQSAKEGNAFRVLVGQARIAYTPYRFLGYVRVDGHTLWMHSWVDNHQELRTPESFRDTGALAEIVYDIGVQLGLGHPKKIAAPLDLMFRNALLAMVRQERDRLHASTLELTDLTEAAWKSFRTAVKEDS